MSILEDNMIPVLGHEITVPSTPSVTIEEEGNTSSTCSQRVFYDLAADTAVTLSDGITLQFSKAMLCGNADSEVFVNMFFGPLQDEVANIEDIDSETFKLFLDCVMGYTPFNFQTAYKILPVAWKYQSNTMIESCLNNLDPPEMNETVIDLLNMSILFNFERLTDRILTFIMNDYSPYKLLSLDSRVYWELLSPGSMKAILSKLETLDSYLFRVIIKWAYINLERNNTTQGNVKDFLQSVNLLEYFKITSFESSGSLHDFLFLEKNIFSFEEVIQLLKCPDMIVHKNSKWKKIRANTVISEVIVVACDEQFMNSSQNSIASIKRNRLICYTNNGIEDLNCIIKLEQQNQSRQTVSVQQQLDFNVLREVKPKTYAYPILNQNHVPGYNYTRYSVTDTRPSWLIFFITYMFPHEGRILLTNRPGDCLNICMYFTEEISSSIF